MKKANELRIGNWIEANGLYIQVETIGEIGINFSRGIYGTDYDYTFEDLEGIPLTPEILEKCGFICDEDEAFDASEEKNYPLYKGKIDIALIDDKFYLWIVVEDHWYSFRWTELKHLHQLQNLIFALTGKELEVNL